MENKIYISCPISINGNIFLKAVEKYNDLNLFYWCRDTQYNANLLVNSNLFVLVLPDFEWSYNTELLPVGCKKELDHAITSNKKLYILYKSRDGNNNYNIYETRIVNKINGKKIIEGIPGTSNSIVKYCDTNNLPEYPISETTNYDNIRNFAQTNNKLNKNKILLLT